MSQFSITAKNVSRVIRQLKRAVSASGNHHPSPAYLMPASIRGPIDRSLYKGRGRPRSADYTRIPFPDYLGLEESQSFNA